MLKNESAVQDNDSLCLRQRAWARLWSPHGLSRRVLCVYPGEVRRRRRIRIGQIDPAAIAVAAAAPSAGRCRIGARRGDARSCGAGRGERRFLFATDWAMCTRIPRWAADGVSAGANVGERLMAVGWNHYDASRDTASILAEHVEIDIGASTMRREPIGWHAAAVADRAQPGHRPRLVFMDDPPVGSTVSVQARLLRSHGATW